MWLYYCNAITKIPDNFRIDKVLEPGYNRTILRYGEAREYVVSIMCLPLPDSINNVVVCLENFDKFVIIQDATIPPDLVKVHNNYWSNFTFSTFARELNSRINNRTLNQIDPQSLGSYDDIIINPLYGNHIRNQSMIENKLIIVNSMAKLRQYQQRFPAISFIKITKPGDVTAKILQSPGTILILYKALINKQTVKLAAENSFTPAVPQNPNNKYSQIPLFMNNKHILVDSIDPLFQYPYKQQLLYLFKHITVQTTVIVEDVLWNTDRLRHLFLIFYKQHDKKNSDQFMDRFKLHYSSIEKKNDLSIISLVLNKTEALYLHIKSLRNKRLQIHNFECCICLDTPHIEFTHMITPCGHHICYYCYTRLLQDKHIQCPLCRGSIHEKKMIFNKEYVYQFSTLSLSSFVATNQTAMKTKFPKGSKLYCFNMLFEKYINTIESKVFKQRNPNLVTYWVKDFEVVL